MSRWWTVSDQEARVKFRCERDTLADAVTTAGRAVASRTGAMPVLSGLRLTVDGQRARAGRVRPRAHDPGHASPVDGDGDGSTVLPVTVVLGDRAQARWPDAVTIELDDDDVQIEAGRFATTLRTLSAIGLPAAARVGGAPVSRSTPPRSPRPCARWCRRASRDDARPILTGVLLTAPRNGLRLVATDSYRLAVRDLQGVSMLSRGPEGPRRRKGLGEVQRLLGDGEIEVLLGRARSHCSGSARAEITDAADRGRVPELPAAHPERLPEPAARSRATRCTAAVNRVRLVGQGRDAAPIRLAMSADGPRAVGHRAGRR